MYLGEAVLRSLPMLPAGIGGLLSAFPYDFLYGSIATDPSIAKKYAAAGRHSHSWDVGFDILERARDEPLRAFSYGYLAHLAADVVAHNWFVPHQLAITSSTVGIGHSYWETRFETHLGEWAPRRARELILLDHSRSDGHLDRILSPTIFSTPTNRRIFRGMVRAADMESWQRVFQMLLGAAAGTGERQIGCTSRAPSVCRRPAGAAGRRRADAVRPVWTKGAADGEADPQGGLRTGGEDAVANRHRYFACSRPSSPTGQLHRPLYPPVQGDRA